MQHPLTAPTAGDATPLSRPEHIGWRALLVGGAALFGILVFVLFQTQNPNLYPTVVLIGSFLVPIAFVAFVFDHLRRATLSFEAVAWAFVIGGVLGVLGASVVEPFLLPRFIGQSDALTFRGGLVVAMIEEACKLAAVMFVARRLPHDRALDGLLLGTAVGMGFAAFESTGYAFTILFVTGGDVSASLIETVLRAATAPFGHGIWTGIAAAALFHDSSARGWRAGWRAIVAFALVVVLHGAWDGLHVGGVLLVFGVPVAMSLLGISALGLVAFLVAWRLAARRRAQAGVAAPLAPAAAPDEPPPPPSRATTGG
jgi:RsiW-degrading membrane proteinase PrsW (M82 family)